MIKYLLFPFKWIALAIGVPITFIVLIIMTILYNVCYMLYDFIGFVKDKKENCVFDRNRILWRKTLLKPSFYSSLIFK